MRRRRQQQWRHFRVAARTSPNQPRCSSSFANSGTRTCTCTCRADIDLRSTSNSDSQADFASKLAAQGAQGFRFFTGLSFDSGPSNVYVKDLPTTYTYEFLASTGSANEQASQLNAEGARGFKFGGLYSAGTDIFTIYRRSSAANSTFTYAVLDSASSSGARFGAELNTQGANGYRFIVSESLGGATARLYERANPGNSNYTCELLVPPTDDSGFAVQLNAEGAKGYRFRSGFYLGNVSYDLYEKDASQSASFAFSALDPSANSSAFVTQANAQGQAGSVYVGPFIFPSGASKVLYTTPQNCTAALCVTYSAFGF